MSVRISVVIPTLGRTVELERCLTALTAGDSVPDEIVVVDQSGGGEIADLIGRIRSGIDGARRIDPPSRGLSAARNAGAAAARGDVVAFTDDDCVPDRRWIEALRRAFADAELSAVTGPMLPFRGSGDGVPVSSRTESDARVFTESRRPWAIGTGGNTAVRIEAFREIGGFDERLGAGTAGGAGEDLDLFRRLLTRGGARIRYEPGAVCGHGRVAPEERRARRPAYGRGGGAALGRWLRDGDPGGLVAIGAWLWLRTRRLVRSVVRLDFTAARDEWLVLRATAGGLVYGARAPAWSTSVDRGAAQADR